MKHNLNIDSVVSQDSTSLMDSIFDNQDAYVAIDWLAKEEPIITDWCKKFIPKYLHHTIPDSLSPEMFNQLVFIGTSCVLIGSLLSKIGMEAEFSKIMAITGTSSMEIDTLTRFLQFKASKEAKAVNKDKELFVVKKGVKKSAKHSPDRRVSREKK